MTEQIDKMTPRELNDACATEVMRWHKAGFDENTLPFPEYFYWVDAKGNPTGYDHDFSPATQIEEAWVIFQEMAKPVYWEGLSRRNYFIDYLIELCEIPDHEIRNWALDITPDKICRAALKAVMKEAK